MAGIQNIDEIKLKFKNTVKNMVVYLNKLFPENNKISKFITQSDTTLNFDDLSTWYNSKFSAYKDRFLQYDKTILEEDLPIMPKISLFNLFKEINEKKKENNTDIPKLKLGLWAHLPIISFLCYILNIEDPVSKNQYFMNYNSVLKNISNVCNNTTLKEFKQNKDNSKTNNNFSVDNISSGYNTSAGTKLQSEKDVIEHKKEQEKLKKERRDELKQKLNTKKKAAQIKGVMKLSGIDNIFNNSEMGQKIGEINPAILDKSTRKLRKFFGNSDDKTKNTINDLLSDVSNELTSMSTKNLTGTDAVVGISETIMNKYNEKMSDIKSSSIIKSIKNNIKNDNIHGKQIKETLDILDNLTNKMENDEEIKLEDASESISAVLSNMKTTSSSSSGDTEVINHVDTIVEKIKKMSADEKTEINEGNLKFSDIKKNMENIENVAKNKNIENKEN